MAPPRLPKVVEEEDTVDLTTGMIVVMVSILILYIIHTAFKDDTPSDYDKCVDGDSVMIYESSGGKTCIKLEDLRRLYGRP